MPAIVGKYHEERSAMPLDRITRMMGRCASERPLFPPTDLYNEGWMLRLLLDWFSAHPKAGHVLAISKKERWYSEALLPSAFLPRYRGDRYAEAWTHADGVIGDFSIGESGAGDLALHPDAGNLVVLEAKMFSRLSPGITHARYYNQAARTVACMAEVLRRANRPPSTLKRLSFFVIAPQQQIDAGLFEHHTRPASILRTVQRRVAEYDAPRDEWFDKWFMPTMQRIGIELVSWERLIDFVAARDAGTGSEFGKFYGLCLKFNSRREPGR